MDEKVKLRDGHLMPKIGFGTYQLQYDEVSVALEAALSSGYRLIDTATVYRNESAIRDALNNLKPIDDIFITSKLAPADHGYEEAIAAVQKSRENLGLNKPIDLYLVHWPGKRGLDPASSEHAAYRKASWMGLEECVQRGWVRSIGVSNYEERHLREMEDYAKILPAVNQIEVHPYYIPEDTIRWCQEHRVFIQAYSSLGRGLFMTEPFLQSHPFIQEIALKHSVGFGQIFLRWSLQKGFGVLPKSKDPRRIWENARVVGFVLSWEEMGLLDGLKNDVEAKKICWDPKVVS